MNELISRKNETWRSPFGICVNLPSADLNSNGRDAIIQRRFLPLYQRVARLITSPDTEIEIVVSQSQTLIDGSPITDPHLVRVTKRGISAESNFYVLSRLAENVFILNLIECGNHEEARQKAFEFIDSRVKY